MIEGLIGGIIEIKFTKAAIDFDPRMIVIWGLLDYLMLYILN